MILNIIHFVINFFNFFVLKLFRNKYRQHFLIKLNAAEISELWHFLHCMWNLTQYWLPLVGPVSCEYTWLHIGRWLCCMISNRCWLDAHIWCAVVQLVTLSEMNYSCCMYTYRLCKFVLKFLTSTYCIVL